MQIYLYQNNKEVGPYTEEQLRDMMKSGVVNQTENAWHEGFAEWQPLNKIISFAVSGLSFPTLPKQNTKKTMNTSETDTPISHEAQQVIKRYRSAYRVAGGLDSIGNLAMGVAAFVLIGAVAFIILEDGSHKWLVAIAALVVMFILYAVGTLFSALGQGIKAQLDTAVHTSPFITEGQKAIAMNL